MKPRIDWRGFLTVALVEHLVTSGGEPVMSCCPNEQQQIEEENDESTCSAS
jgi:hypothetical protein